MPGGRVAVWADRPGDYADSGTASAGGSGGRASGSNLTDDNPAKLEAQVSAHGALDKVSDEPSTYPDMIESQDLAAVRIQESVIRASGGQATVCDDCLLERADSDTASVDGFDGGAAGADVAAELRR